jgi:hypothetical protein
MRLKSFALRGVAVVALAGIAATPALAFTHHPSTPAEQQQTDDLNARSLTAALGTPAQTVASAQPASLDTVANPPQTLANANVETSNGQAIGAVQKVVVGADGKASLVDVALRANPGKIVEIDAGSLSYDQSRNVVVTQLNSDQINAMPAVPQT